MQVVITKLVILEGDFTPTINPELQEGKYFTVDRTFEFENWVKFGIHIASC